MVYVYHLLTLANAALTLFLCYRALTTRSLTAVVGTGIGISIVVASAFLMLAADKVRQHEEARVAMIQAYGELMSTELGPSIPPKAAARVKNSLMNWAGARDSQCSEIPSVVAAAVLAENVPAALPDVFATDLTATLSNLCNAMAKHKATASVSKLANYWRSLSYT